MVSEDQGDLSCSSILCFVLACSTQKGVHLFPIRQIVEHPGSVCTRRLMGFPWALWQAAASGHPCAAAAAGLGAGSHRAEVCAPPGGWHAGRPPAPVWAPLPGNVHAPPLGTPAGTPAPPSHALKDWAALQQRSAGVHAESPAMLHAIVWAGRRSWPACWQSPTS